MSKRSHHEIGFYSQLVNFQIPLERVKPNLKTVVIGEYLVERIVAHKIVQRKPMFLVKWLGYAEEENTWEPAAHLPLGLIDAFKTPPQIDERRLEEWKALLKLQLERGLKTILKTDVAIDFPHEVFRCLFPRFPTELPTDYLRMQEADLLAIGFQDSLAKTVTCAGRRRKIDFPVLVHPYLGKAPAFFEEDGTRKKPRLIERLRIQFLKS